MDISFAGKRALVTGAASGIGKEIAVRLSQSGAKVLALDKSAESLVKLKQEHPEIETVEANLADWHGSKKVIKTVLPIDLLVNNAGIATINSILDVTPEEFDSAYGVNIRAMFNVTQTVVESLYERKSSGAIVNMSSQAAKAGLLHRSVYCSSKAAVDGFTRALAVELGPKNIRINAVNPTVVMTDLGRRIWADPNKQKDMLSKIPLNKFAEVNNVADAVLFLLSDKASMIHGHCLPIDGGFLAC